MAPALERIARLHSRRRVHHFWNRSQRMLFGRTNPRRNITEQPFRPPGPPLNKLALASLAVLFY